MALLIEGQERGLEGRFFHEFRWFFEFILHPDGRSHNTQSPFGFSRILVGFVFRNIVFVEHFGQGIPFVTLNDVMPWRVRVDKALDGILDVWFEVRFVGGCFLFGLIGFLVDLVQINDRT